MIKLYRISFDNGKQLDIEEEYLNTLLNYEGERDLVRLTSADSSRHLVIDLKKITCIIPVKEPPKNSYITPPKPNKIKEEEQKKKRDKVGNLGNILKEHEPKEEVS